MVCSDCGFVFINTEESTSVKLLSEKLQAVSRDGNKDKSISEQKDILRNFIIPQTKEDILAMLYFIFPKTKVTFSNKTAGAWREKFIEVLGRAKITFANDKPVIAQLDKFEVEQKISIFGKLVLLYNGFDFFIRGFLVYILFSTVLIGLAGLPEQFESLKIKREEDGLKIVETEVIQSIMEQKFEDALLKLINLDWRISENRMQSRLDDYLDVKDKYCNKRVYWKNKKSELKKLLEEKKKTKTN